MKLAISRPDPIVSTRDKDQVWEGSMDKLPDKSVLPLIIRFAIPVLLLFLSITIPTILYSWGQKVDTTWFLHSLRVLESHARRIWQKGLRPQIAYSQVATRKRRKTMPRKIQLRFYPIRCMQPKHRQATEKKMPSSTIPVIFQKELSCLSKQTEES